MHLNLSPRSRTGPHSEDLKGNADPLPGMALKTEAMSTSTNGEECGICTSTNSGLWTLSVYV